MDHQSHAKAGYDDSPRTNQSGHYVASPCSLRGQRYKKKCICAKNASIFTFHCLYTTKFLSRISYRPNSATLALPLRKGLLILRKFIKNLYR